MIAIEGLIGAGKTTLGKMLSELCGEPFYEELSDPILIKLLDLYYHDQPRWSFLTQVNFLLERYKKLRKIARDRVGILDRTVYGDKLIARFLSMRGIIQKQEYQIYLELYQELEINIQAPSLLVCLQCEPEVALERIKQRNRNFELQRNKDSQLSIDLTYLTGLANCYYEWFENYDFSEKLVIDYNRISPNRVNRILENIVSTYKSIRN